MTCAACGAEGRTNARFCDGCGAVLATRAPPARAAVEALLDAQAKRDRRRGDSPVSSRAAGSPSGPAPRWVDEIDRQLERGFGAEDR